MSKHKGHKFHVDFADLEIELRKSIHKDQISEGLGVYIMKIVQSVLASRSHLRMYSRDVLDELEFEAYMYIIDRLLQNYNVDRTSGYAFIKAMALNRIRTTKRAIHTKGLNQDVTFKVYNRKSKRHDVITLLTLGDL